MSRILPLSSLLVSPLVIALALATAACNRGPSEAAAPPAQATAAPAPLDQPREDVPPATAPMSATSDAGTAHYDGYAKLRFGMTAAELAQAWEGELNGMPEQGASDQTGCYYLNPVDNPSPAYLALMMEHDKFVRYDVSNDKDVAPGGGKVGMDVADIEKLYPERIKSGPHKYVEGAKYLRINADDGSGGVLVFETDTKDKVTQWRVGQPPAVDYVEGCS